MGGPCDFSVSPSPFGLDFGTLDFGTSDLGLTIIQMSQMVIGESNMGTGTGMEREALHLLRLSHPGNLLRKKRRGWRRKD